MMPLDKLGNPYTPMTEAEKQVARNRPYPEGFSEHSARLRKRHEREALEPARVYHVSTETRAVPEPMHKALGRKTRIRRGR